MLLRKVSRPRVRDALRVSAASSALAVLAGCSVFNPHVRVDTKNPCTDTQFAGGMSCAVDYANKWRTAYYRSVGNDSILRNSVSLTLIPLSAVALYKGVTSSDSSHSIAALGIGAASLYTAGNILQSAPRQKVYLAGSQAVGCAVLQMRPLLMLEKDYQDLQTNLTDLQAKMTATTSALRLTEALLAQAKSEGAPAERLSSAEIATRLARTLLEDALKVRSDGRALAKAVQNSGLTLRQAVDDIRDTVSSRISDTEPDLASIMAAVGNLGNVAQGFKPSIPAELSALPPKSAPGVTIKGAAPKTPSEDGLARSVEDLQKAVGDLTTAMNPVSARLDDASAAQVDGALKGCTVAQVDLGFSVSPDSAQQTMEPGSTLRFDVTSASGAPRAALAGTELKDLNVRIDVQNGAYVVVVTSSDKTGGTAQLVIRDGSGKQSKIIRLIVQKAEAETSTTTSSTTPAPREGMALSEEQIKTVQTALNLDGASKRANGKDIEVIGVFGPQTTAALKEYQKTHGKTVDGIMTQALFTELKKIVDAQGGAPPAPAPAPASAPASGPASASAPEPVPAPTPSTPAAPPNAGSSSAQPNPTTQPSPTQPNAAAQPVPSSPPVASSTASAGCPATPANAFEQTLKPQDIKNIQQALGIPESARTGVLDTRTRAAIAASTAPTTTRPAVSCQLNQSLARAILGG